MYQYSEFDKAFLQERVAQYRDQVSRRLAGALTEEEFKPLRLMNGVYLQLHAYMLRVAIPYGTLSAAQMRGLADISERWDKRLRALHHPAKYPVQLAEAGRYARYSGGAGWLGYARHPNQRQYRSQRHHRSFCRRCVG